MRNWLAVGVVVSAVTGLAAVVAGCSSSAPVSVSDYCDQKATLECQYVAGTASSPGVCSGLASSTCIATRTQSCLQDATTAQSQDREFNPNNITNCLNTISSIYGVLKFGSNTTVSYSGISGPATDTSTVDYACESVFSGTVPANGTCANSFACSNGDVCTPSNGGSKTLVCATPISVPDQGTCSSAGSVCVTGDACTVVKATGEYLCQATTESLGGLNAPCKSDADCDPNSAGFCDTYDTNTCQAGYQYGQGYACELNGGAAPATR